MEKNSCGRRFSHADPCSVHCLRRPRELEQHQPLDNVSSNVSIWTVFFRLAFDPNQISSVFAGFNCNLLDLHHSCIDSTQFWSFTMAFGMSEAVAYSINWVIHDLLCRKLHLVLTKSASTINMFMLKGRISITLDSDWKEPASDSPEDIEAAERSMQFKLGWFANAIYVNGDYPEVMKTKIAEKSQLEGRDTSRLPEFTLEEKMKNLGMTVSLYYPRKVAHQFSNSTVTCTQ